MSETNRLRLTGIPKSSRPALLAIAAGIALVAFLAGFIPMWIQSNNCADELRQAERQGAIVSLQSTLGSATIDARRAQYEAARQQASQFFTELRAEADQGVHSAFSAVQHERLAALLAQRDELITLLARSDPASGDRLADLYLAYRKAVEPDSPEGERSTKKPAGPLDAAPAAGARVATGQVVR